MALMAARYSSCVSLYLKFMIAPMNYDECNNCNSPSGLNGHNSCNGCYGPNACDVCNGLLRLLHFSERHGYLSSKMTSTL